MLITDCVKKFLEANTWPDLSALYSKEMEMQLIVGKDGGEKIESEYKGRSMDSYTDGLTTWYPIRIPKNANKEAIDNDREATFDIATHTLALGLTGHNWIKKQSEYVFFDFDAVTGHSSRHSKKLSDIELKEIEESVAQIPWVTLRKSTSGNGLHIYINLEPIKTENHVYHAALARWILGNLSAVSGCDLQSKVDACGHIGWIFHRKMIGTEGLKLLKQGIKLSGIPDDWKSHIQVITGKKRRVIPKAIEESSLPEEEKLFLELTSQRNRVEFDEEHKKVINYLQEKGYCCDYNSDLHLITSHAYALKQAHIDLKLKGVYDTITQGTEQGDWDLFMFPDRNGGWTVKRFTMGVSEAITWEQDGIGYTTCKFNTTPDLRIACKVYGGIEDTKGGFIFSTAEEAQNAALMLNSNLNLPKWAMGKKTILRKHIDGRLHAKVECDPQNDSLKGGIPGFYIENKYWNKLFSTRLEEPSDIETINMDNVIRHLLTPLNSDAGWAIKVNNFFQNEPLTHVIKVLKSMGYKTTEADIIIGKSIIKSWSLVNLPFQPEYLSDRQWNRNAAQFKYIPLENKENLQYPTWLKLLNHVGKGLDHSIKIHPWAKENNILTGADYLKCWIASLFQYPTLPLPYLFFYGPENVGKSSFHESIALLITHGIKRADNALTSTGNFNAELENAVLCIIEETNLRKNKIALNKLRDWVTSPIISIHGKGQTPYDVLNCLHFVQCSNDDSACPVFMGDTRIVVLFVDAPEEIIPKKIFLEMLKKEAQDFLTAILSLEIPPTTDRLNIPVIITEEKLQLQESNLTEIERFIKENCFYVEGSTIKFSDFYNKFINYIDPNDVGLFSKIRVSREIPIQHVVGALAKDTNQKHLSNISWEHSKENDIKKPKLILRDGNLVSVGG